MAENRLNLASKDELCKPKNIGETLAGRIDEHKPYSSLRNLKKVPYIGPKRQKEIEKHFVARGYDGEVSLENLQRRRFSFNKLFILHVNIRDLRTNIDKIREFIGSLAGKPDVICVSDSRNPTDEEAFLDGYTFKCKPNENNPSSVGGVAIYVKEPKTQKENIFERWRDDLIFEIPGCENIWLNITWNGKSYVIGAIYRHPERENDFKQSLKETIEKLKKNDEVFYILGDFNLNLQDDDDEFIQGYRVMLQNLGAVNLIPAVTSVEESEIGSSSMLLDHIITNDQETSGIVSGVIRTDFFSDHYPVYVATKEMPPQ